MIFFKPEINSENTDIITFVALENDVELGSCELVISENKATIVNFACVKNDHHIIEGLVKSAFNYACSKNCYMGYCNCAEMSPYLNGMNFIKDGNLYYNDIPSILMGSCCKKLS